MKKSAKPKKPLWKQCLFLCLGLAIGWGLKGGMADLSGLQPPRLILVELFTSLGCPACPPADKALLDMAEAHGQAVLPLAFHVENFNTAEWRDPLSESEFTARHRDYGRLSERLYTPQVVVEGRAAVHGNDAVAIAKEILKAADELPVLPVSVARKGEQVCGIVPARADAPAANLWVASYQPLQMGRTRGGKEHAVRNAVRRMERVAWQGEALEHCIAAPPELRAVAWLQEPQQRRVLGLATDQ